MPKQNKRVGCISLHSVTKKRQDEETSSPSHSSNSGWDMHTLQHVHMEGVLDCKWEYGGCDGANPLLGTADSEGSLSIFELREQREERGEAEGVHLEKLSSANFNWDANPLALSLDWSTRLVSSTTPSVVVSYSDGGLAVWEVTFYFRVGEGKGSAIWKWLKEGGGNSNMIKTTGGNEAKGGQQHQTNAQMEWTPIRMLDGSL